MVHILRIIIKLPLLLHVRIQSISYASLSPFVPTIFLLLLLFIPIPHRRHAFQLHRRHRLESAQLLRDALTTSKLPPIPTSAPAAIRACSDWPVKQAASDGADNWARTTRYSY